MINPSASYYNRALDSDGLSREILSAKPIVHRLSGGGQACVKYVCNTLRRKAAQVGQDSGRLNPFIAKLPTKFVTRIEERQSCWVCASWSLTVWISTSRSLTAVR